MTVFYVCGPCKYEALLPADWTFQQCREHHKCPHA